MRISQEFLINILRKKSKRGNARVKTLSLSDVHNKAREKQLSLSLQ